MVRSVVKLQRPQFKESACLMSPSLCYYHTYNIKPIDNLTSTEKDRPISVISFGFHTEYLLETFHRRDSVGGF